MGWFNKQDVKENSPEELPQLPSLPKLPRLNFEKKDNIEPIHQLPSFPMSNLGQKFSQNAIKEAVTGKKDGDEDFDADEYEAEEDTQMMHKPLKKPMTKELPFEDKDEEVISHEVGEIPKEFVHASRLAQKNEPIFIRIDKFEEGLQIFEKAKKEIIEIERMLKDTRKLKEDEEIQLSGWEKEIQTIKKQIEDIDKDIFSKI